MEWLASATSLVFAAAGLGWVWAELARGEAPAPAGVRRLFLWSVAGLLGLVPAAMVPLLLVYERDFWLGTGLGCGVFFTGIVPVAVFMYLATTQFVRSEDRTPVVLGPESLRRLRIPLAGSIVGGLILGLFTIWLVARPPAGLNAGAILIGALVLAFLLIAWPMLAINACANRERAARPGAAS